LLAHHVAAINTAFTGRSQEHGCGRLTAQQEVLEGVHVERERNRRRHFGRKFKAETVALIRSSGKLFREVCVARWV